MKTTNSTTAAGLILWINGAADHQVLCGAAGPVISCYAGASNYPKSNTIDNYTNFSTIGVVCTSGTCVFYQDGASIGTGAQTISSRTLTNFGGSTSFFSAFDLTACLLATAAFNANQIALATHILTNQ
jgi:hypothetical protein